MREVRIAARMTQAEVAKACHTGQSRLSRIENGYEIPERAMVARMVRLFHVKPEALFSEFVLAEIKRRTPVTK